MKLKIPANHSVLESTGDSTGLKELAERMRKSSVSVIKEMMYLGALETQKGNDVVSLGVGIPFYPAPKHVHDHIISMLKSKPDIDKYTLLTGLPSLRNLFASVSTDTIGIKTTTDEILVTAGSMAALFYSVLSLVNPGEEVILPSPYFSSHGEQVSIASGVVVPVPLWQDPKYGYRLDVAKIKTAITKKTKAIILNTPHNPTGAVFLREDLLDLADVLIGTKIYLITDEVYDYLIYDGLENFNIASVKELWPRVIRCCSLSKKYGMMGWRIGYLHTHKKLLMHILKIHDANIVCAPHVSQEAAIAALSGPQDCVLQHKKWLDTNRTLVCKRLDVLSGLFSYIKPLGTYYVFPKYSLDIPSIEMAKRLLYEAGVVLVPGIGFGPEGEHHLRISFGAPQAQINEAFDRIEKWWNIERKK